MVAGDFLTPSIMLAGSAVVGLVARPHWKSMDNLTKTVIAFIPGMVVFGYIVLLIGALFQFDFYS